MSWTPQDPPSTRADDPICGLALNPSDAPIRRTLGETTFYFCSSRCRERFDQLHAAAAGNDDRRERYRWVELPLVDVDRHGGPCRLRAQLAALPGVHHATVNGADRLALIEYDSALVDLPAIVECARRAGVAVRTATARLTIRELHCPFCAGLVERALRSSPGVVRAFADAAAGQARAEYLDGLADPVELAEAIEETGLRGEVAGSRWSARSRAGASGVRRPTMA